MKLSEIEESTFRKVCDKHGKKCEGCPFHKPWKKELKPSCSYGLMMMYRMIFGRWLFADKFDSIEIDLGEEEQ